MLDARRHHAHLACLAALYEGDLLLPEASEAYVLFPGVAHGTVSASDWIR